MKTIPVTSARRDIFNIIEQTIVNSEPIQITSKNGDVVMLSVDDWSAIQGVSPTFPTKPTLRQKLDIN